MKPLYLKMQAFGSYGSETEIDFTKSSENLFLITGDTGAGKSTIFDAIAFALYGEASGSQCKKEGVMLQSQFATYDVCPRVQFTFAYSAHDGSEIYTVIRIPKHFRKAKRKSKSGRDYIEENGSLELILPDGTSYGERDVQKKIESIVGLTKPQFMQVAMIAQGEFMELLRADTKSKVEIFRKLFHTDIYENIKEELKKRKEEKDKGAARLRTECLTEIGHVRCPKEYEKYEEFTECQSGLSKSFARFDEYIVMLGELCDENEGQAEWLQTEWEKKNHAWENINGKVQTAQALEQAYNQQQEALEKLEECRKRQEEMQSLKKWYQQVTEAFDMEPYWDTLTEAQVRLQKTKEAWEKQREMLPGLQEKRSFSEKAFLQVEPVYQKAQQEMAALQEQMKQLEQQVNQVREENRELYRSIQQQKTSEQDYVSVRQQLVEKEKIYFSLYEDFLDGQAGILAGKLREGEPCPVCGSRVHPAKFSLPLEAERALPTQDEVEQARRQKEKLAAECEERAVAAKEAQTLVNQGLEHLQKVGSKILKTLTKETVPALKLETADEFTENVEQIFKRYKEEKQQNAEQTFADVERDYQKCFGQWQELQKECRRGETLLEQYEKQYRESESNLEKRRQVWEERLARSILTQEEIKEILRTSSKEEKEKAGRELEQYERERTQSQAALETAQRVIQSHKRPDLKRLLLEKEETAEQLKELAEKRESTLLLANGNREAYKRLVEKDRLRNRICREQERVTRLYQVASGQVSGQHKMDLETYVQRRYLQHVLVAANRRFERMTAGQFRLALKNIEDAGNARNEGLDLMVYSLVTGKYREVRTLSGGESFMAALSLALGMADEIQLSSGAIHLDMMFIDEGFGSLDEHSRNQAIRILKELAGGERLIGIISHVTELKGAIDNKLVVTKGTEGSKVRWEE